MVFQSYALYPHMNVYENMSFGLKMEKHSKSDIEKKVNEAAKTLQIQDLLDRKPKRTFWRSKTKSCYRQSNNKKS